MGGTFDMIMPPRKIAAIPKIMFAWHEQIESFYDSIVIITPSRWPEF
jgi:hypothetical protein